MNNGTLPVNAEVMSVTFGDKNTWADWKLLPVERPVVAPPMPVYTYTDLLLGEGKLDQTENLIHEIRYLNRQGSWKFRVINDHGEWYERYSDIMEYLHGKSMRMILSDDPTYYYEGRFSIEQWSSDPTWSGITIHYNLSPYKQTLLGTHIFDVAMQQLKGEDVPNSIYTIGRDNTGVSSDGPMDKIQIKKRPYSRPENMTWNPATWEVAYEISLDDLYIFNAAIEFDGAFLQHESHGGYYLACEEEPWIFFIASDYNLYAQHGYDESTRFILETQVTGSSSIWDFPISAVRGYKSSLYPEQDQGLIVAYIIDNQPYYKNYCQSVDRSFAWSPSFGLPRTNYPLDEKPQKVQVHRLNDYRVGFVTSFFTAPNVWNISERTYVGTSTPAEFVHFELSLEPHISMLASRTLEETHDTERVDFLLDIPYPSIAVQAVGNIVSYDSIEVVTDKSNDETILTISSNYPLFLPNGSDPMRAFQIVSNTTGAEIINVVDNKDGTVLVILSQTPELYSSLVLSNQSQYLKAQLPNAGSFAIQENVSWTNFGTKTYRYDGEESVIFLPSIEEIVVSYPITRKTQSVNEALLFNLGISPDIKIYVSGTEPI